MNISDAKKLIEITKNLNILYVEDDIEVRDSILSLINNFFLNITIASDGKEGYEKYIDYKKENNKYFDLVLSDVNMPNIDGLQMSKLIFKENKDQKIIIVSARNTPSSLKEIEDAGIKFTIQKPIAMGNLLRALDDILKS